MAEIAASAAGQTADIALDPFALLPDARSKIAGLGGDAESPDINYVFHTEYVHVAEGHAHFRVRFHGLAGKFGTLLLRVHMYQKGATEARLAISEQVLMSRLVILRGAVDVRFEAFGGVTYALYGSISGHTDAAAQALEVTLDRPGDENAALLPATEARNSSFGRDAALPTANIISARAARLAAPVTQIATEAQRRERVARQWAQRLAGARSAIDGWSVAYCLQALESYGMLQPGAHGLGIETVPSGTAALVAAAGPSVTVVGPEADGEAVRRAHLAAVTAAGDASERIAHRASPVFPLARELVNFDFLWSDRVATRLGSVDDALRFLDTIMAPLRPGGIAVHVLDFLLPSAAAADMPGIAPLRRRELDRIALVLISRSHAVAQVRVEHAGALLADGSAAVGACGLIVRKAATVE